MSYIQAIPPRRPEGRQTRSAWRWFPWAVFGSMSVVIAVNVYLVVAALHTFPGRAGNDGFDLSNSYERVLATSERQAALGWTLNAAIDEAHHPVVLLRDRDGMPLQGAVLGGQAERPLGPAETTPLAFQENEPGRYVAEAALGDAGQWELRLTARTHGDTLAATRRIVVR